MNVGDNAYIVPRADVGIRPYKHAFRYTSVGAAIGRPLPQCDIV